MRNSTRLPMLLKEVCLEITVGYVGSMSMEYVNDGVPLLRSLNVKSYWLNLNDLKYISMEFHRKISKSSLCEGDVVIVRTGLPGTSCVIPKGFKELNCSDLVIARPDTNKINPFYLSFYFNSIAKKYVANQLVGAIQQHFNIGAAKEMIIDLPGIDEQGKIVKVLNSINSKIELNNRINAELEVMAKTLYDYWFVQFDFPDKNGKPYKSSGGKMVWNERLKREIPDSKEWCVGTLLDIANYDNGLPCQKFRPTSSDFLRVIKIREMNEGFSSNTELVRPNIPQKSIIENGDVLFSWSASLEVKIWTGGKGALNQHIFKVTSTKYPKSLYYHQLINYLQHFKMMAENRKTTMGHITQEHLQQSRIAIPPKDLTNELEKIISPMFAKKMNNEIENQSLTELRNWLLPMLMNGQVKVKGGAAEK